MHIVLLSDTLNLGGASIAATNLEIGLKERGLRVSRVVSSLHGSETGRDDL